MRLIWQDRFRRRRVYRDRDSVFISQSFKDAKWIESDRVDEEVNFSLALLDYVDKHGPCIPPAENIGIEHERDERTAIYSRLSDPALHDLICNIIFELTTMSLDMDGYNTDEACQAVKETVGELAFERALYERRLGTFAAPDRHLNEACFIALHMVHPTETMEALEEL
jgi:hypothetical protein